MNLRVGLKVVFLRDHGVARKGTIGKIIESIYEDEDDEDSEPELLINVPQLENDDDGWGAEYLVKKKIVKVIDSSNSYVSVSPKNKLIRKR